MNYYIDTNSLIHYRLFSDIDWNNELNDNDVTLVICTTVLKELDNKKFSELDIDIRNRCKVIVTSLRKYVDDSIIKKNVKLVFKSVEPNIDWKSFDLDNNIPDDRILAAMLSENNLSENVLVTSDIGILLKARLHKIKTHQLNDELRIMIKQDKKDQEIRKLTEKILKLENNLPNIELYIQKDNELRQFAKLMVKNYLPSSLDNISSIISKRKLDLSYTKPIVKNETPLSFMGEYLVPDDSEIQRYEADVQKYLIELEKYYKDREEIEKAKSCFFELNLVLQNIGSSPAEDIDVFLHFPDGFDMLDYNPFENEISEPDEPIKPQTQIEKLRNISMNMPFTIPNIDYLRLGHNNIEPPSQGPKITRTHSYDVTYHFDKLKHTQEIVMDPLYILFDSQDKIQSFCCTYKLSIGNYPDAKNGEISIIFEFT